MVHVHIQIVSKLHMYIAIDQGAALKKSSNNLSARIRSVSGVSRGNSLENRVGDSSSASQSSKSPSGVDGDDGQRLTIDLSSSHSAGQESTGTEASVPPNVKHQPCCIVM